MWKIKYFPIKLYEKVLTKSALEHKIKIHESLKYTNHSQKFFFDIFD